MAWKDKERAREYNRKHYLEHREHYLQYQKERNEKHKLYMREYRAKMYKDKEKERARCRDYHRRHREEVNAKHREKYWKIKEEKLDRPVTLDEFREWYGYPAGTLEGWQDWDPDRCVDLAAECARELGESIGWRARTTSRHATRYCWKQQSAGCTNHPWRYW